MGDYVVSYLSFSIVIHVTVDVHYAGMFRCQASIQSADGKKEMSMSDSERFPSEVAAKAFGLDWAKALIDNITSAGKT
jgi:hypothetical protein